MRSTTVVLQIVCVALGLLFISCGFSTEASLGGFLFGSVMFFAATLLGTDHTTNSNKKSRNIFKILAAFSALPFVAASVIASLDLWRLNQLDDFVATLLRLTGFTFIVLLITFDSHPFVQRLLKKLGLSVPEK